MYVRPLRSGDRESGSAPLVPFTAAKSLSSVTKGTHSFGGEPGKGSLRLLDTQGFGDPRNNVAVWRLVRFGEQHENRWGVLRRTRSRV